MLLGGLLALLALGLNLIFGVIDVVWICYAELIMIGMYAHLVAARAATACRCGSRFRAAIALVGAARRGAAPTSSSARCSAAEPINQLLVTGGVLFFLQAVGDAWPSASSSATSACSCRAVELGDMYFSLRAG